MIEFCHIHCGELTEQECLDSISSFKIRLSSVRNVYPQVSALNLMFAQVQEEYFVELNSDMILNSNALERIETAVGKHQHDKSWHSILFRLHDTFTDKDILSLKVMRSSIMKKFLFKDVPTPDVEHYDRLKNAGYKCITEYLPTTSIGKHVLKGQHICYHKYRDVYATLRFHKREWDEAAFMGGITVKEKSKKHFDYFLYMYVDTGNEDYLAAIAGMVDGLTCVQKTSKSLLTEVKGLDKAIDNYFNYYNRKLYD